MKHLILSVLFIGLLFSTDSLFAHTPLPLCGVNPQITWNANTEKDMAFYAVYTHITTDVLHTDAQRFTVPHDGETLLFERAKGFPSDISQVVMYDHVPIVLNEGSAYFGVTAVDQAGNESEVSDVIGCQVVHPDPQLGPPTRFRIGITVQP